MSVVQEEMSFRFLICISGRPPDQLSETIYAILKECIMGNIHVKLCDLWNGGSGGDVVSRHFLSRALEALLFSGLEPFVQFLRRHHEEQSCEIIMNLDQWFRWKCC